MKCPLISLTCLFPNSKMLIYNFLEIVFNTSIQQRNTHSKAPLTLAIIKTKKRGREAATHLPTNDSERAFFFH